MTALNALSAVPTVPSATFTASSLAASVAKTPASGDAAKASLTARTLKTGQDFEAMFLNSMFSQMNAGVGEGPYSGGQAAGVWRSFLTDEYAKSFAKAGGIGIAADVQRALLAQQEAR
jgi:flagellar protein FlgJ